LKIKFIKWEWNNNYCVFSSEEYLLSQSESYGWIGGFIDEKLVFVIPYIEESKLLIRYIYFTSDLIQISSFNDTNLFYKSLIKFLSNLNFAFLAQQPPQALSLNKPKEVISAPFGSYRINLLLPEEQLWGKLHVKHRNVIRNSIKKDVVVEINSNNYEVLFELMNETMNRSNMSFLNKTDFVLYMNKMEGKQISFISYYHGVPQGCAIIPFSQHAAYYSYGGSIRKPLTGAINYMHWEAIKYFKNEGVRIYDFVGARINPIKGSKQEGLQRFKSRFGGDLVTGFLWKKPISKFQYNMFRFLQKCKKRDFNFNHDIIDQELKR